MNIKEILTKIANGEELTDTDKQELTSYEPPSEDKIAGKIIARERSKYESQMADLQKQLNEFKTKAEELESNSDKSEAEKLIRKIELLNKKLEEKDSLIQAKEQELFGTKKSQVLSSIKSKLNLVKDFDEDYVNFVLDKKTKDYQDLDEIVNYTDDIVEDFRKSHPMLIKADDKAGTGLPSKGQPPVNTNKISLDRVKDMSSKDIVANLDEILGAMKNK